MVALALSSEDRVLEAPPRRRLGGARRREGEPTSFEGWPRVPVAGGRASAVATSAVPWPRAVSSSPANGVVREAPPVAPPPPRDAPVGVAAEAVLAVVPVARTAPAPVRRRSLAALLAALALHAAVAMAALLGRPAAPPEGGGLPEEATIVEFVDLGSNDRVDSEAGATAAPPSPVETSETVPPDPAIDPAPWATAVADMALEPIVVPDSVAEPVAAEPVPVETPPVLAAREAEEAVPPPPVRQEAPPSVPAKPETTKAAKPVRSESRPAKARPTKIAAPTPASAPAGSVDRRAGRASGGAEASTAGEVRSWRAAVLAALARAKRYPEAARALGQSGRAVVTFTIGRDGRVAGVALAGSSGVAVLDRAALEMPGRAQFPPMPAGLSAAQTFTAGVRYDLH